MKIDTRELHGVVKQRGIVKQPDVQQTGRFDELLEKAINTQSGQTAAPSAIPPLQTLSSLNFTIPPVVDRSQTVKQIDELLDVVESYKTKLADPKISLKEINPLVQQMEKMTAAMTSAADSLPEGDKLKEILNGLLVTSTVETIKFNRGDYV